MVVFLSGVRTGFGAFGGSLKNLSRSDLGVVAAQGAIERSQLAPGDIGHVVFGNVMQSASDAIYLARHVGLRAGLLVETPAVTVNRLCGSGFESIVQGAQLIMLGEADAVLAGGAESMSMAPHLVRGARWGLRLGPPPPMEDMLWSALTDSHCNHLDGADGANGWPTSTSSRARKSMRWHCEASSAPRPHGMSARSTTSWSRFR